MTQTIKEKREQYFIEENESKESKITISDSGKYKLVIHAYTTKAGCWNYSRGRVYNTANNELLADVKRNYHGFPFLFIENHPNGNDYLVCGEDYQGQTIVNLNTKQVSNLLDEDADKGWGFCWVTYKFYPESRILAVSGCYWACPYETKLFDFSAPDQGWPEIKPNGQSACIPDLEEWPTIENDILTAVHTNEKEDEEGNVTETTKITNKYKIDRENLTITKIIE